MWTLAPLNAPLGEWTPLAIVHSTPSRLIYRNGVALVQGDAGLASVSPNAATYIGADVDAGSSVTAPFEGAVDEVRIYSRALDPTELVQIATGDP